MADEGWRKQVEREAGRIQEDTLYSFKGHFNAADRWEYVHWLLGIPASIVAAAAGTSALARAPGWLTGSAAFLATALTGIATFLNPSNRWRQYFAAGNAFKSLHNRTRIFAQIELPTLDREAALAKLHDLRAERDRLNESSPPVPQHAYRKAHAGIEAGQAQYAVDVAEGT